MQAADRLRTWAESDLKTALSAVAKEHPDALFVYPDPILIAERKQIAEFAVTNRLPTMFAFREFVDAGGLMSHGASLRAMGASAGELIAKILAGTRPSELPVEQATRFELVINLKTARALGLTPSHGRRRTPDTGTGAACGLRRARSSFEIDSSQP